MYCDHGMQLVLLLDGPKAGHTFAQPCFCLEGKKIAESLKQGLEDIEKHNYISLEEIYKKYNMTPPSKEELLKWKRQHKEGQIKFLEKSIQKLMRDTDE